MNYFNPSFSDTNGFGDNISSINQQDQISKNIIKQSQQIENQSTYIKQIGTGLKTMLQQENGGNTAIIKSFGQNITQIVTQSGSGNTINSLMINTTPSSSEAHLYQEGMNNNIILWVNQLCKCEKPESLPITIMQEGNDFRVSALINYDVMPITIHQFNGFAGGMEVQIRTEKGFSVFSTKK
ncbi:MAG: hypothetical protein ACOYU1_05720 [Bacteroidota bacterium]